jgi:CDP-diacylglycerol--serine O-phosphatidyltransferase
MDTWEYASMRVSGEVYPEVVYYDFFAYLNNVLSGEVTYAVPFFALAIPFFSLFRLAKFNIDERQSQQFIGLPTPANTLFFMTFPLVLSYGDLSFLDWNVDIFQPEILAFLCVTMSILLIVEVPLFALKFNHFKWKENEMRYAFLLISAGLILVFKTWAIALIVFLYVVLSLVNNIFNKRKSNEI